MMNASDETKEGETSAKAKKTIIYLYIYDMGGDIGEQKEKSLDVLFVCFLRHGRNFPHFNRDRWSRIFI
jgi:hypothetical protein